MISNAIRRFLALLGLSLAFAWAEDVSWGAAASGHFLQKLWTMEHGLPESTGISLCRTRDGYLWVGTFEGLARSDGQRFTSFTSQNTRALLSDRVLHLFEDRAGTLWIGTAEGLVVYRGGRFERASPEGLLASRSINAMAEDASGTLWVAVPDALMRWSGTRFEQVPLPTPGGPEVIRTLLFARDGTLWIGGNNGLFRFAQGKLTAHRVDRWGDIKRMVQDPEGRLWMLYRNTHAALLDANGAALVLPGSMPREGWSELVLGPGGQVLISTVKAAIYEVRGAAVTLISPTPEAPDVRIMRMLGDSEGNLWVGLDSGGVAQLRERHVELLGRKEGLPTDFLTSLHEDALGRVYIGTWGNGLVRYDHGKIQRMETPGIINVTSIAPNPDGSLWIGTGGGPAYSWNEAGQVAPVSHKDQVKQLLADGTGGVWVATYSEGVEHVTPGGYKIYQAAQGLPADHITALALDGTNGVWVGTVRGIGRIQGDKVTALPLSDLVDVCHCRALWVDDQGTLWAGLHRGGLLGWREGRGVLLREKQGLPNDTVRCILPDSIGNVWIGTMRGLLRVAATNLTDCFEHRTGFLRGRVYGTAEGFRRPEIGTANRPSCLAAQDGRLWFLTAGGIVMVDPRDDGGIPSPPEVRIEEVLADGQSLARGGFTTKPLELAPGSRELEIRYAGIDFLNQGNVEFRYRLAGVTTGWDEVGGRRSAFFSSLRPGDYDFQVAAGGGNGVWSPAPARLRLRVLPAWWQTWGFRVGAGVLFAFMLLSAHRFQVGRLERRRRAQESFSRQMIESQEAERKRIASELHDSLGQNLLVVRNLALLGAGEQVNDTARKEFQGIADAAAAAISEVRTISHALRPVELDRLGLTKAMEACALRVAESSSLRLSIEIEPLDGLLSPAAQITLYRILQEGLNNIVKHSEATEAAVVALRDGDRISLTISDNGRGFVTPERGVEFAGGLGLPGIVERVRLLGGECVLHSGPGQGVRWQIGIPVTSK